MSSSVKLQSAKRSYQPVSPSMHPRLAVRRSLVRHVDDEHTALTSDGYRGSPVASVGSHAFDRVPVYQHTEAGPCSLGYSAPRTCPAVIQAKLVVGEPDDKYEKEADRIADEIMRMPDPRLQSSCLTCEGDDEPVQMKPLADQITPLVQRQVEREDDEEEEPIQMRPETALQRQSEQPEDDEEPLQMKGASHTTPWLSARTESAIRGLQGGGRPLTRQERDFFEPRFGHDFSGVRVHADAQAVESARSMDARAYTAGRHLVFGAGQHAFGASSGQRLLAHELAHVVQQENTSSNTAIQRREPGAPRPPSGATPPPANAPAPPGRPSPETRTRHEIAVVDFGVNRDVANWRGCLFRIGEIEASSVDQMVRDVRARAGDPARNCIGRLTLDGHGSPGNMSVGDGTGWVAGRNISTGHFRPSLNQLTPYFCEGSSVVLLGCNVGRGATGARFIQQLSNLWHVNVAAATGLVRGYGIEGVWVWGLPGQVLPNDTALIVDQIARIMDERTYGDDEEMIFDLLEAGNDRGLLAAIQADLVQQARWNRLREDLIDEDQGRYQRLFPT